MKLPSPNIFNLWELVIIDDQTKYHMLFLQNFVKKLQDTGPLKFLMIVAPICGSIVTIYNFGKIYDGLGLPRPIFYNEFQNQKNQLKQQIIDLEIDYRSRAIKSDLKLIRDINKEILILNEQKMDIPDSILEFKQNLEENIQDNRDKLKVLNKSEIP